MSQKRARGAQHLPGRSRRGNFTFLSSSTSCDPRAQTHPGSVSRECGAGSAAFASTKGFNADFLITYLVHPGTAVYAGYNSNLSNLDRRLLPMPTGLLTTRDEFLNDSRQFFVKISYLWRP